MVEVVDLCLGEEDVEGVFAYLLSRHVAGDACSQRMPIAVCDFVLWWNMMEPLEDPDSVWGVRTNAVVRYAGAALENTWGNGNKGKGKGGEQNKKKSVYRLYRLLLGRPGFCVTGRMWNRKHMGE